ncbi:unnamed protein product, partial [Ectocarpus sp. 4 AP-2014]
VRVRRCCRRNSAKNGATTPRKRSLTSWRGQRDPGTLCAAGYGTYGRPSSFTSVAEKQGHARR